jgi:CRP-like cAMP-binding protein
MALEDDAPARGTADTRPMTNDDLRLLRAAGSECAVPAGALLIERGQPGAGLFVILEGSVVVEAPEGVRELGAGAVVGERALAFDYGKRTARVRTTSDVRVLAVSRAEVDRLLAEHSSLSALITAAAS